MWCLEKHLFSNVMSVEESDVKIPKKFLSILQVGEAKGNPMTGDIFKDVSGGVAQTHVAGMSASVEGATDRDGRPMT